MSGCCSLLYQVIVVVVDAQLLFTLQNGPTDSFPLPTRSLRRPFALSDSRLIGTFWRLPMDSCTTIIFGTECPSKSYPTNVSAQLCKFGANYRVD